VIVSRELDALAARSGLPGASIALEALGLPAWQASVSPERPLYPASMIKLPIAVALATRCAGGDLGWEDRVLVEAANLTANDAPSPMVEGYRATLEELLRAMLSASDNVATNVLIDVLGRETIAPACAPFGLRATAVRRKLSGSDPLIDDPAATGRNALPAADAALLLRAIALAAVPAAGRIYDALRAQHWNDKLSRGLRGGDEFAHKTGETSQVSHDGGILTLPGGARFVLVVYTALPSCPETDAKFAGFASAVRPYLD